MEGPSTSASTEGYVRVEYRDGYAVLFMVKEPVNSLDLNMWAALEKALDVLEANPAVNGLIIATGLKKDVFSAGNDLKELYARRTTYERYREFWIASNRFVIRLFRTRLATIAAIRGACPAGGCVISLCCDHRAMTSQGNIGLNEVQLGMPVPKYWGLLMTRLVGQKAADKLLLTGKMVTPLEAKALGMIDQVVDNKDQLLPAVEKVMAQLVRLPAGAVAATKLSLREDFCAAWEAHSLTEPEGAWEFLNRADTLQALEAGMAKLGNKADIVPPKPKL